MQRVHDQPELWHRWTHEKGHSWHPLLFHGIHSSNDEVKCFDQNKYVNVKLKEQLGKPHLPNHTALSSAMNLTYTHGLIDVQLWQCAWVNMQTDRAGISWTTNLLIREWVTLPSNAHTVK